MRRWTGDRGISSAGVLGLGPPDPKGRNLSALGLDTTAPGLWTLTLAGWSKGDTLSLNGSPRASI